MGTYLLITPREDELYHFGIKGMKWGVRRFQPYQKGERVKGGKEVGAATKVKQRPTSGNIVERYKAHKLKKKRIQTLKKARETRKANADLEAEKQKAINSGSIEDLAKFKGSLTNEEYNRAFIRLQNEKKMADLVAANQKTVWDTLDKGMNFVQKVGGYANTIATAKENFNKLDDAFHKRDRDDEKERSKAEKEAAKNAFMNKATYEELVKNSSKYNLTTKDYNTVLSRLTLENKTKGELGVEDPPSPEELQRQRTAQNAHAREQANSLKYGFYKTPPPAENSNSERENRTVDSQPRSSEASSSTPETTRSSNETTPLRTPETTRLSSETTPLRAQETRSLKDVTKEAKKPISFSYDPTKNPKVDKLYEAARNHTVSSYDKAVKEKGQSYIDSLRDKSWESLTREEKDLITVDSSRRSGK